MLGIKIPKQDFALKRQGGAYARGGRICGTLWYMPCTPYKATHL